jgi:hypothetical protein
MASFTEKAGEIHEVSNRPDDDQIVFDFDHDTIVWPEPNFSPRLRR